MSINVHLGEKKIATTQRFLSCTCNRDGAVQGSRKVNELKEKGNCAGDTAGCNAGTKSTKNRAMHIRFFPLIIFCGGIASTAIDILKGA